MLDFSAIPPLREGQMAARMVVSVSFASHPRFLRSVGDIYEVDVGDELVVVRDPRPRDSPIEGFLDHFPNVPPTWMSTEFLRLHLHETTVQVRIKYPFITPAPFVIRLNGSTLLPEFAKMFITHDRTFISPNPVVLEIQERDGQNVARISMRAIASEVSRVGTHAPVGAEALLVRNEWALRELKPGKHYAAILADALEWLGEITVDPDDPASTEDALAERLKAYLLSEKLYTDGTFKDRIRSLFDGLLVTVEGRDVVKVRRTRVDIRDWNRALRQVGIAGIVNCVFPAVEANDDKQVYKSPNTSVALLRLAFAVKRHGILQPEEWAPLVSPSVTR